MTVLGIGIDTVDIERFENAVKEKGKRFLERIFTEDELKYAEKKKHTYTHMAGKFAAKEAVKKALPNGVEVGLGWPDIEIANDADGKPYAVLHGQAKKIKEKFNIAQVLVSISHTHRVAVSNAVVIQDGQGTH